jgi:PAS domain S-box-containing protein
LGETRQSNHEATLDPCLDCDHTEQRNKFLNGICSLSADSKKSEVCCVEQLFDQYQETGLIYKHLIKMAPDAIFVADTKTGTILEANSKAAELLGIPVDQIIGMHQTQLHPPGEVQQYKKFFQKSLQIESGSLVEDTYVRNKDGKDIPVRISASVMQMDNKEIILGIFSDISGERKTLQNLKASEKRYKHLSEATFEGICINDEGRVLDGNPQFADMFGYSLDEIKGLSCDELVSPQSLPEVKKNIEMGYEGPYEALSLKKDGSTFPTEVQVKTYQSGGKTLRMAAFRDLTFTKQQQRKLTESDARFKQLADASFEGIIIHDLDNDIVDFNQQLLDMFGYTSEELKQLPMMEMVAPQSRDTVAEKIASGYFKIYQTYSIKKDDTIFPVLVHCKEALRDSKPIRIVSLSDMTEQEQVKHMLSESETKYKELYQNARACLFRTRISDGLLLDFSRATTRLLGYTNRADYENSFSVTKTYVDPQQRELLVETLKKNERVHGFEVQLKRKDGSPIWVAISAEIFPEKDYIEGAMQDISVIKVLTKSENEILKYLMQSLSNKEIAFKTGRSVRTIEDHRAHIMHKLEVENIVDLTQKALKLPNHYSKE